MDGSFSWKFVLLHSATLLVEVSSNRRVDLSEETSLKFPQKKKRNIIVRFDKRNNFKPKIITNKFLHLKFSLCQWIKKWHTNNQIAINRQFFNIYIFILLFLHFLFTLQKKKKKERITVSQNFDYSLFTILIPPDSQTLFIVHS